MIKFKKISFILIFFFLGKGILFAEVPYFLDFKYILNKSDDEKKAQIF